MFQEEKIDGKIFHHADCHYFLWGMERGHMTDYLIGADQKNLDCFRLYFWESLEEQVGQVLNLSLVSWHLTQVMVFWVCSFLFNKTII